MPREPRWHDIALHNGGGYTPTEENANRVTFSRDEAKHKDVFAAAVVALGRCLTERALGVQDDSLVLGTDEVIDDVRGGCIATRSWVVYAAITTIGQSNLRVSAKDGHDVHEPASVWRQVNLTFFFEIVQNSIEVFRDTPICGL